MAKPSTDNLALNYSRLAMATLTSQNYQVHSDGALYDPVMLELFKKFEKEIQKDKP